MAKALISKLQKLISMRTKTDAKPPASATTDAKPANPHESLPTIGETVRGWIDEGLAPTNIRLVKRDRDE